MAAIAGVHAIFNAASYFIDRNVEFGRGSKVAIVCGGRLLTYEDVRKLVNSYGNALASRGLDLQQRTMLLLPDSPEFVAAFFGAMKIGAIPIPVNTLLRPPDYRYMLEDSRARVLVVATSLWPSVEPILKETSWLRTIAVVDDAGTGLPDAPGPRIVDLAQVLVATSAELDAAPTGKDDVAFWLYSSGTTGFPKGTIHLQRNFPFSCDHYGIQVLRITESDRTYSVAKLFSGYGLGNALHYPFAVGATTILYSARPSPEAVLELATRTKPTLFFAVPSAYAATLEVKDRASRFDLSSVRLCISAGEPLPVQIFERWKEEFGFEILDGFGTTETGMFISNTPGAIRPGSSGKVIDGYDVRLVNDDGKGVAQGEIGRLQVTGGSVAAGYWNKDELTKATFLGQWCDTGDLYRLDERGYYWFAGRTDDMLKVSGYWVSPVEVENTLLAHESVLETAVVGVEDEAGLIKPVAYVVVRRGSVGSDELARQLQSFVKERLAPFKYPRHIHFVEELPKTATGKIQRYKLRTAARAMP